VALEVLTTRIVPPMMFEQVRDRIAAILVAELANQEALAIAASASPVPYQINVTTEKTDPWSAEQFPLINVWYDTGDIDTSASSPANMQQGNHFYNLDCYDQSRSEDDSGNIVGGDELSAKLVQQTAGIVWQIIMADLNARLQFPARTGGVPSALVASRIFEQLSTFQPSFGDITDRNVQALRLRLKVRHVEISPFTEGDALQESVFTIKQSNRTGEPEDVIEIPME